MEDPFEFEEYLVRVIKEREPSEYGQDPFDLYLPNITRLYKEDMDFERYLESPTQYLMDAAWALCLRGILRPGASKTGIGILKSREQYTGQGFGITKWGRKWIEEGAFDAYIPGEPQKLTGMFEAHSELLGQAYIIRAKDAVRCLFAHAYYACCAMCGAASEAIVYSLAVEAFSENVAMEEIRKRGGIHRLVRKLSSGKPSAITESLQKYVDPVKYWRDVASHGKQTGLTRDEALLAMLGLAAFARFSSDNWEALTACE